MQKFITSSLIALSLFGAGIASAQTYYPSYGMTYGSSYSASACITLTSDLSLGSRGAQVSALQRFLVSQNYPGGGAWMITGYYGQATAQAVRNFQQSRGLAPTGAVDFATRAAINAACFGGSGYLSSPSYAPNPFSYSSNTYATTYPFNTFNNSGFPYAYQYGAPSITSMSQNTGVPGNSVTLYGTGFDAAGNIVYVGAQAVPGIPSSGTSLTFTVPGSYGYSANQSVELRVSNSRGTSNPMTFTLYPYGSGFFPYNQYQNQSPCGAYPYSYGSCGCGLFGVGCPNTGVPTISFLSPNSGSVGASVTIFGSGFSSTGNSIRFGSGIIAGLNSSDGRAISFTVPAQLTGFGTQVVTLGTYNVSVTNASGAVSNALPFTVTSVVSASGALSLSSLSPTFGRVGTQVVITGGGFNALDNTVHFGVGGTLHVPSFNGGTTIYYTIPYAVSACDLIGASCAAPTSQVTPGSYSISVSNANGTSNTMSFQVQS